MNKNILLLTGAIALTTISPLTAQLTEDDAQRFTQYTINKLISNPSYDASIETLRTEMARVVVEQCRHGWWHFSYFQKHELYNTIINEIIRYVGETSYRVVLAHLEHHEQSYRIARELSTTITKQLETIIIQLTKQHVEIRSGHVSPFIGKKLQAQVLQTLNDKGYLGSKPNKLAQENYTAREQNYECSICFERYSVQHPKVNLSCEHSFCRPCLLRQYEVEGGKKLACGICHTHIDTEKYAQVFHPNPSTNNYAAYNNE